MATVVMTETAPERCRFDWLQYPRRLLGSLTFRRKSCPIQRLPDELLSYVFLFAMNDSDAITEAAVTPITISHVGTRWRRVALSTSKLWTSINLALPYTPAQVSRMRAWLLRSRSCPLDILLDFRDPDWSWDEDAHIFTSQQMQGTMAYLLPHVTRWRSFDLLCDTWHPIFTFLSLSQHVDSAPFLRRIALSRCNAYFALKGQAFAPAALKQPVPLLGKLPPGSLCSISLAGVHVDWSSTALRGLTELELKYHASEVMPSLKEFAGILTACPQLRGLSIIGWGPRFDVNDFDGVTEDDASAGPSTAPLLHLLRFAMGFLDITYAIQLLRSLAMPCLEDLALEDVSRSLNPEEAQDATPLLEWLAAPLPSTSTPESPLQLSHVSSLHLNGISASKASFAVFADRLRSLRALHITNVDDDMIAALNPSPTISALDYHPRCPLLAEVTCDAENIHALSAVVLSRKDFGCSPFQKIYAMTSETTEIYINDMDCAIFLSSGVQLFVIPS
ncbi:hypothetical protein HGRIS_009206 [Hohenbuehelia grisea]|uniref:F-box domain-containing protein n=1 Tax=Hohenbuehelia grisea TaxID=104357 RepID=A0ABR3J0M2_9AGAR